MTLEVRWTEDINELFVSDDLSLPAGPLSGGFMRRGYHQPQYRYEGMYFFVGESGDFILANDTRGTPFQVPLFDVGVPFLPEIPGHKELGLKNIEGAVQDRMKALFAATVHNLPVSFSAKDREPVKVAWTDIATYFRDLWKSGEGTIHVYELDGLLYGVFQYAGIRIFNGETVVSGSGGTYRIHNYGLVSFSHRVQPIVLT